MAWNQLENNVKGTLDTGIGDVATSMDVTLLSESESYPAGIDADNPIYLTISNPVNPLQCEVVKVTAVTGSNIDTMVRAQRGTSALSWVADSFVSLNLQHQDISEMREYMQVDGKYIAPDSTVGAVAFGTGAATRGLYGNAAATGLSLGSSSLIEWGNYTQARTRSGGTFTLTDTLYYEGTNQMLHTIKASRGTSGAPDYLNDNDILYEHAFEALDGSGTYGESASIKVMATDDHASGDTPAEIAFYTTPSDSAAGADTEIYTGAFRSTIFYPGILDIDLPYLDTRIYWPKSFGSDCGFGYYEDIMAVVGITIPDGVSVSDITNPRPVRIVLGNDDKVYFGGNGNNAGEADTWRIGNDSGTDAFVVEQYDGIAWNHYHFFDENTQVQTGEDGTATGKTAYSFINGATHNYIYGYAGRGTTASTDYLDEDDSALDIQAYAIDSTGTTWGDVGSIKFLAASDHALGDTHGKIVFAVTPDGTDTEVTQMTLDEEGLLLNNTVWNDLQFSIDTGKVPPADYPDWDSSFTTNTGCYKFGIDEYIDLGANEIPHWAKANTDKHPHVHFALDGAQATGGDRYVKFTLYIAYCTEAGGAWTETSLSAEKTIPTGSADLECFYLDFGDWTTANVDVGAQVKLRIKRIAATGGTELATDVFVSQVGIHLEQDRIGSDDELP